MAEVERLYRINLLRQLGLSLVEIGKALDDAAWNLKAALGAHVHELSDGSTKSVGSTVAWRTYLRPSAVLAVS